MIAIAVTSVVVSGIVYLHPHLTAQTTSASNPSKPALVTAPGDFMLFDFVSPSLGWALGASGASVPTANPGQFSVFRTTDAAKHWVPQLVGHTDLTGMDSGSIQMFDEKHGFVFAQGAENTTWLYRTVDGGAHWEEIGLPNAGVQELAFGDSRHGWLLASPAFNPGSPRTLYVTSDGGDTWQAFPSPPVDSGGMAFRGSSEGWLGGNGGQSHVYASTDGGRTWRRHDLPDPRIPSAAENSAGTAVRLLPPTGVVAYSYVADGPADEFTSFDGGASWSYVPPRPGPGFGGWESFEDALHWWAIDGGILYKSSDAGQTWTTAGQMGDGDYWQNLDIIDARHAWAQVVFGHVTGLAVTNDGGRHWTRATVPQSLT